MATARPTPSWVSQLNTSEKYLTQANKLLASRESQRTSARSVSRTLAQQEGGDDSDPSPAPLSHVFGRKKQSGTLQDLYEHYSVAIANDWANFLKNRYSNVEPYDRTRVVVKDSGVAIFGGPQAAQRGEENGRYLNASWVLERFGQKWWIAAQAPLGSTAHAFLSVVLQPVTRPPPSLLPPNDSARQPVSSQTTRVRTVVQLTQNVEQGRKKADAYFPNHVGRSTLIAPEEGSNLPSLEVTLLSSKSIPEARCVQSTVSLVPIIPYGSGERNDAEEDRQRVVFQHMLYTSWPDHGVPAPEDQLSVLAFINLVDKTNRDISFCQAHPSSQPQHTCDVLDPDPPIMVGCSAGIGRTGSFIALSSLLRHAGYLQPATSPTSSSVLPASPLGPIPEEFRNDPVVQEVDSLREQRPGMVQRPEQVFLIYEALMEAFSSSSPSQGGG